MRRLLFACFIGGLILAGCSGKDQAKPTGGNGVGPSTEQQTPEEKLFVQLRSGVFQINNSLDSIEEALKEAKATTGNTVDLKESLDDIQASIDSAGENLGDQAAEEPNREAVAKDMKAAEKRRQDLINLVNDSLHDMRDARGIVDSLAGENEVGPLENVGIKIDAAMDDLRFALEALGGKEEIEE